MLLIAKIYVVPKNVKVGMCSYGAHLFHGGSLPQDANLFQTSFAQEMAGTVLPRLVRAMVDTLLRWVLSFAAARRA
jgi:hypothetical protein